MAFARKVGDRLSHRLVRRPGSALGAFSVVLRISEAKERVGQTALPIVDVVSGYPSPNHVTRVVWQVEGMTPTVFRAQA